jgi:threonine synthase
VNSINWARILAQVVYYIYGALRLSDPKSAKRVDFSVPTGNFGDIFAGYVAKKMMPGIIGRLILATNENDLLTRFVNEGDYSVGKVTQTSSPSMDIQVASNFERYLFLLYERDPEKTRQAMDEFARTGRLQFSDAQRKKVKGDFSSRTVDEGETSDTIAARPAYCGGCKSSHGIN